MQIYEDIHMVGQMLDTEELLCQFAEECMELSMAAHETYMIELDRNQAVDSSGLVESREKFEEEAADVLLVAGVLKGHLHLSETENDFSRMICDQTEEIGREKNLFGMLDKLRTESLMIGKWAMKLRRARTK